MTGRDDQILRAAVRVFTDQGADAPMSAIAKQAGMGMSALYRRYPSKDDLQRAVTVSVMEHTRREAERALGAADAWQGFVAFVRACVDDGVAGSPRLVGSFAVTEEVLAASRAGREAVQRLVEHVQAAGELRKDINAHDIALLLAELRMQAAHAKQPANLHERLLGIVIDGLRERAATPLPAPPATWHDLEAAWKEWDAAAS